VQHGAPTDAGLFSYVIGCGVGIAQFVKTLECCLQDGGAGELAFCLLPGELTFCLGSSWLGNSCACQMNDPGFK
jgi:hypothetical protein